MVSRLKNFNLLSAGCLVLALLVDRTTCVTVEQITEGQNFTKGLFWDCFDQVLLFVDVDFREIHRLDFYTGVQQYLTIDKVPTFVIPTLDYNDRFVIGENNDLVYFFWDYNGTYTDYYDGYYAECLIVSVESYCPGNIFSIGKADFYGLVIAGTFKIPNKEGVQSLFHGSLYHFNTGSAGKAQVNQLLTQLARANDVAWTTDYRIMYFAMYEPACVFSFHYDLITGTICDGQFVFCFPDFNITGFPDGLTVDTNNNLWIAGNGAGMVLQINPNTQDILQTIPIPVATVTDVEFGGCDLDILFVATREKNIPTDVDPGNIYAVYGTGAEAYCSNYAVMNSDCTPEYFT